MFLKRAIIKGNSGAVSNLGYDFVKFLLNSSHMKNNLCNFAK